MSLTRKDGKVGDGQWMELIAVTRRRGWRSPSAGQPLHLPAVRGQSVSALSRLLPEKARFTRRKNIPSEQANEHGRGRLAASSAAALGDVDAGATLDHDAC